MATLAVHGRVKKDLLEVAQRRDPETPPVFAKPHGDNLDHIDALVIGPPETPYEFGFFRFEMKFLPTYPNVPPKCEILTTNGGQTRFNPNLYAGGKVCLSILGTWSGESEDEWRSSYSIAYVLGAIQSLIMNAKPYHNEPGYEESKLSSASGSFSHFKPDDIQKYSDKIKHETLRVAVCGVIESTLEQHSREPFGELSKYLFLMWYENYVKRAHEEMSKDGTTFAVMPFEYETNRAAGKYNYIQLLTRIQDLKKRLDTETESWKVKGKELTKSQSGWKYFKLLEEYDKIKKAEVELDGMSAGPCGDDNLFYWNATIFGPENGLWEGGIYTIEMVFNEEDDTPPRIRFITKMFHPNISPDGIPFYVPPAGRSSPVISVLQWIRKLLKDEPICSPTTFLNLQAAKLYISKDENEKKEFKKQVAKCVRASTEG